MSTSLSRRSFLVAATSAGVLAACGSGGDDDAVAADDTAAGAATSAYPVPFFGPYFPVGTKIRVPFGLADEDGLLPLDLAPASVVVDIEGPAGAVISTALEVPARSEGLHRPYYSLRFRPEDVGVHTLRVEGDGVTGTLQVDVRAADDPVVSAIAGPGDPFPALATPTVDDDQGVTPICTRDPACDLHERSLDELIGAGESIAVLISTPAYCQIDICGPVLDILLDELPRHEGIAGVHIEVYRDPANNSVPPKADDLSPAVRALGLPFEPVLYTIDGTGTIVDRLDYIFSTDELSSALSALT